MRQGNLLRLPAGEQKLPSRPESRRARGSGCNILLGSGEKRMFLCTLCSPALCSGKEGADEFVGRAEEAAYPSPQPLPSTSWMPILCLISGRSFLLHFLHQIRAFFHCVKLLLPLHCRSHCLKLVLVLPPLSHSMLCGVCDSRPGCSFVSAVSALRFLASVFLSHFLSAALSSSLRRLARTTSHN